MRDSKSRTDAQPSPHASEMRRSRCESANHKPVADSSQPSYRRAAQSMDRIDGKSQAARSGLTSPRRHPAFTSRMTSSVVKTPSNVRSATSTPRRCPAPTPRMRVHWVIGSRLASTGNRISDFSGSAPRATSLIHCRRRPSRTSGVMDPSVARQRSPPPSCRREVCVSRHQAPQSASPRGSAARMGGKCSRAASATCQLFGVLGCLVSSVCSCCLCFSARMYAAVRDRMER